MISLYPFTDVDALSLLIVLSLLDLIRTGTLSPQKVIFGFSYDHRI